MEEHLLAEEIKTETSSIEYTECEKLTAEGEDGIKEELFHVEEQIWRSDLNSAGLELGNDKNCNKTEIQVHDEKLNYIQLKKETEDTVDHSIFEPRDYDTKDVSAHCSIKQEFDYHINEELDIKDVTNFESCGNGTDDLFLQSEGTMQNGTQKLDNEKVNEENTGELVKLNREHLERDAKEQGKEFKCDSCNFTTKSKPYLKSHTERVHLNIRYKCCDCDYSTAHVSRIYQHRQKEHPDGIIPEYKCNSCEFTTKDKKYLKTHIDCVHLVRKVYKCNECDFLSVWKSNLKAHEKIKHLNEIDEKSGKEFKCNLCAYVTHYKPYLTQHLNRVHSKQYECNDCDFSTLCINSLSRHWETEHSDKINDTFKCNLCDFTTKYKKYLKTHIDSVHSVRKVYECNQCDFSSVWKNNLKAHKQIKHLNEIDEKSGKGFKCNLCVYVTHYKPYLSQHMNRLHSNKQYECNDCDFSTPLINSLYRHRETEHSNKIKDTFKCNLCDFITKYKKSLRDHIKHTHLEEQFKCDDCNFLSASSCGLRQHRKTKHR